MNNQAMQTGGNLSSEQIETALKRFNLYLLAGDRHGCAAVDQRADGV